MCRPGLSKGPASTLIHSVFVGYFPVWHPPTYFLCPVHSIDVYCHCMNSRNVIWVVLPLLLVTGAWLYTRDGRDIPPSPPAEKVREATTDLSGLTGEALYQNLKGPLEEALRNGMTEEEQLDFVAKLRAAGMATEEWEKVIRMLEARSNDPVFILKMANLMDAGSERENVLSHAFEFVSGNRLPMFTVAIQSVRKDSTREFLTNKAIDALIKEGDIRATVGWVRSLADPEEEIRYCGFVLNALVQDFNADSGGKPLVPFKSLTEHFTEEQLNSYRKIYGSYYIAKGDLESFKDTIATLPVLHQYMVLETSIEDVPKITSRQAEELLKLVSEEGGADWRDYTLMEMARKIRATEGDEAAERFIEVHPQATPKRANP